MSSHRPDLIGIVDYLEGILPPDAERAMEHHLERCERCRSALERERQLLRRLDGMARVEPPPDFVEAVMARVAQYPAYEPPTPVPWRRVLGWSTALGLILVVLVVGGITGLLRSGTLAQAGAGDLLSFAVAELADFGTFALGFVRGVLEPAAVVADALARALWRVVAEAAGSGWMLPLTLLLLTVTMNYAFTRLVLSYQRRH